MTCDSGGGRLIWRPLPVHPDGKEHGMIIENQPLDRIKPGDRAELKRLCTADDLLVFAVATGNHNPMHLPDTDADGDGKSDSSAPGIFLAAMISAVLGNLLPGPGTMYRHQTLDFRGHARAGDELVARVVVVEVADDGLVRLSTEVQRLPVLQLAGRTGVAEAPEPRRLRAAQIKREVGFERRVREAGLRGRDQPVGVGLRAPFRRCSNTPDSCV